jgi:hypothetical protein
MFWEKSKPKTDKRMFGLVLKRTEYGKIRSIHVDICGTSYSDGDLAKLGYKPVYEKLIVGNDINALEYLISEFSKKERVGLSKPVIRLEKLDTGYNARLYAH